MGFISLFKKKSEKTMLSPKDQTALTNQSTHTCNKNKHPLLPKKEDEPALFSVASQDDMRDFIQIQDNNDINLYLAHYDHAQREKNGNDTLSSSSTSTASLQDALFSHFSDTQSELSRYSALPVDDMIMYKKYLEAQTSTHPFELFENIVKEGILHYDTFHPLIQQLIGFAQYRAGCLLGPHSSRGLAYLNDAAKKYGNTDAFYMLGVYAERRQDFEAACDFYHQATGHVDATLAFGHLLLFQNVKHPRFTIQQAIDMLSSQKSATSFLALALYYEKQHQFQVASQLADQVVQFQSTDFLVHYQAAIIFLKAGYTTKAFKGFGRAVRLNPEYTPALRKLGSLYYLGIGTAMNPAAAFSLMQEAARRGDEPANIILAQFYHMGVGCNVDLTKALAIYQNYPDTIAAQLSRGLLLKNKNPALAYQDFVRVVSFVPTPFDETHWRIASIQQEAALQMAVWELKGLGGVARDPAKAFATLQRLSEEGNDCSSAHYWLGCAYTEGIKHLDGATLVEPNQDLAFACFLKGKQKAECLYWLGKMLREGFQGHGFSKKDAFGFFLKAADKGYPPAYTQVGVYYYSGSVGTEGRDKHRAFQYFAAAAKYNDTVAIQYLADYIITDSNNAHGVDTQHVYEQLNYAAGVEHDVVAYRMLALVVHSGVDPSQTYESNSQDPLHPLYLQAKKEAAENKQTTRYRFALHCLWKAIELGDHSAGQYLNQFYPTMTCGDQIKTIELFQRIEPGVPNKMSIAFAKFLKIAKNKSEALRKFIEIATFNDMTTSVGWSSRIEASKLVLVDRVGKATTKSLVFSWLVEMIEYNHGKNLFTPYILLAKCHDVVLCLGCQKEMAAKFYESGLVHKSNDVAMEIFARVRLINIFYKQHLDQKLDEHIYVVERLLSEFPDSPEKIAWSADIYYYKGLISLHNGTIINYREIARENLIRAESLGHIMATLELGYLYGTTKYQEDEADRCFQKVEAKSKISFKNRLTEFMVQNRRHLIHDSNEYLQEIIKMKMAAGITYSFYHMERQAYNWFQEISDDPLAQVMILYYQMRDVSQRTSKYIEPLSDLMGRFETQLLDYYGRMAVSYGQLRLGQCYESGHGVPRNPSKALDYYNKAAAYLQNNEIYERLADISDSSATETDLFRTLCHASRNDPDAMFKLAQYYHKQSPNTNDPDVPCEKAAVHYLKAANAGHAASCYYYAKYEIDAKRQSVHLNAAMKSKKAADLLRQSANKNHGKSYYELGQLEIAAGLYEEGVEDLKEAAFLKVGIACHRLGELYEMGFVGVCHHKEMFRIVPKLQTALAYYQDALAYGYLPAMINVGSFFQHGHVVDQDFKKAKQYYMDARVCSYGAAEYALGCLAEHLAEILPAQKENHHQEAFHWFQKSVGADKNATSAKFKIGFYLLHGLIKVKGKEEDVQDAISILEEEKKKNCNVHAMKELARYYSTQKMETKAFQYWKDAAVFEDPEAYEFIAECFEKGILGQTVNLEEASKYRINAIESRKKAMETQHSTIGFKSDYSG